MQIIPYFLECKALTLKKRNVEPLPISFCDTIALR